MSQHGQPLSQASPARSVSRGYSCKSLQYSNQEKLLVRIRYFIRFHRMRHPLERGPSDVNAFLSWLATDRQVAAATQNLALNAIVFLYARVLEQPLGDIGETVRVKRPPRLPVVLTHAEAMGIIDRLAEPYKLMASRMYGAGFRVVEHRVCKGGRLRTTSLGQGFAESTGLSGIQARYRPILFPDNWKVAL